jgi:sec-independent protein translocase protein TatA
MGLDNPIHIAFLLVLLLLVFGAKRLPEIGRSLGAGMRGFKESISGEGGRPGALAQPEQPPPQPAGTTGSTGTPASIPVAVAPVPTSGDAPAAGAESAAVVPAQEPGAPLAA